MSDYTALKSAKVNLDRRMSALIDTYRNLLDSCVENKPLWIVAADDPQAALLLACSLDGRIGALGIGVELLRHEAKCAIEAQKAVSK